MEAIVTLPLTRRSTGLIIDAAGRIPNTTRWLAGVTLRPWGCSGLVSTDPDYCDFDSDELDEFFDVGENPTFDPFEVYNTESCTTLDTSIEDLNSRVETRWSVMISEQVAANLEAQMAAVADVVTTGPINTSLVISMAEQTLALSLHGAVGLVHMSPAVLAMAQDDLMFRDGEWYTPGGHRVVADAGHTGAPPTGESPLTWTEWVYVSGQVLYGLTDARIPTRATEYLNRDHNDITARVVGSGIVAFDPCSVSAIQYGYPGFVAGS
jgi:hypothetical protein